jgi:hypothetical protein
MMETLLPHLQTNNIVACQLQHADQLHLNNHHQEEQSQTNKLLKIPRSTGCLVFSKQAKTFLNSSYLFGIIHGSYFCLQFWTLVNLKNFYFLKSYYIFRIYVIDYFHLTLNFL